VKSCQQAFAEGGRSVCLKVDGDVAAVRAGPDLPVLPATTRTAATTWVGKVERIEQEVVQRLPE